MFAVELSEPLAGVGEPDVRTVAALDRGSLAGSRAGAAVVAHHEPQLLALPTGGEGYLASPAVVAASALVGYMAPPSELGLQWEPEKYGL